MSAGLILLLLILLVYFSIKKYKRTSKCKRLRSSKANSPILAVKVEKDNSKICTSPCRSDKKTDTLLDAPSTPLMSISNKTQHTENLPDVSSKSAVKGGARYCDFITPTVAATPADSVSRHSGFTLLPHTGSNKPSWIPLDLSSMMHPSQSTDGKTITQKAIIVLRYNYERNIRLY